MGDADVHGTDWEGTAAPDAASRVPEVTVRRWLFSHLLAALDVTVAAIRAELAAGRKPRGKSGLPRISLQENGMPRLSDGGTWDYAGPLQYADLLEPPPSASRPFDRQKFVEGRFAEVDALVAFLRVNPGCTRSFAPEPAERQGFDITRIQAELWLAHVANRLLRRTGGGPVDDRTRAAVLAPVLRGMFDERVKVSTVVPVALVRFNVDRLRLAPDTYLMRMRDDLQRARWSVKAYGANGHDGVVGAATHAFVITGWTWPNLPWLQMPSNLVARTPQVRDRIEELFAALRLATGVATGYAQELRVARGWTHLHSDQPLEVHAAGARRYPEEFDDFGWTRDDLPTVTREQVRQTGVVLGQIRATPSDRLALALRRLNGAMMRNDVADAILDATIGLEILLGDGDGQAIGYKLRLRAGALANVDAPGTGTAIAHSVKRVYEARSRIVHGARSRKADGGAAANAEARDAAIGTLRQIVLTMLGHPRYLDPAAIDADLLRCRLSMQPLLRSWPAPQPSFARPRRPSS